VTSLNAEPVSEFTGNDNDWDISEERKRCDAMGSLTSILTSVMVIHIFNCYKHGVEMHSEELLIKKKWIISS